MSSSPGPGWGVVLLRVIVGGILLAAGFQKLQGGVGEELVTGTAARIAQAPGLVRAFGENVVLVHPWFFAQLIIFGELVGGLALFLGALTRPAGFVLAFLFANFYFAGPEEAQTIALLMGTCCVTLAMSRAGRVAGADVFLDERLPRWLTWSAG